MSDNQSNCIGVMDFGGFFENQIKVAILAVKLRRRFRSHGCWSIEGKVGGNTSWSGVKLAEISCLQGCLICCCEFLNSLLDFSAIPDVFRM